MNEQQQQQQAAMYNAATRPQHERAVAIDRSKGFSSVEMTEEEEDAAIDDLFATLTDDDFDCEAPALPDDYELPARECCGAEDDPTHDVVVPCAYGHCDILFCRCGRTTESGWGPIGCPCQTTGSNHYRVFERKMISVGKFALSTKKRRSHGR